MAERISITPRYLNQFKNRNIVPATIPTELTTVIIDFSSSLSDVSQTLNVQGATLTTQSVQLNTLSSTANALNSAKIFVNREIPSGNIDGINTTYTLNHPPTPGSDHLYLNGILIEDGTSNDYSISGSVITFSEPLLNGSKLSCTYYYVDSTPVKIFKDKEIPSGLINGVNAVFTLQNIPIEGSEHLYLNGLLQEGDGNDYIISENIITFINPPETGLKLRVTYHYLL